MEEGEGEEIEIELVYLWNLAWSYVQTYMYTCI